MKKSTLNAPIYLLLFSLTFTTSCYGPYNSSSQKDNIAESKGIQVNREFGRMWTFDNPPLVYLEKEYEFKPDQKWLNSLQLGSLQLGGEDIFSRFGSASFVSPQGLIMTNIRCVGDAIASTLDANGPTRTGDPLKMFKTGFVAATLEQETRLRSSHDEWLTAAQLIKISNITNEVNKGVTPTDNEIQLKEKRETNRKMILNEARKANPKLVPQIVSLYQGSAFHLYLYRVYKDIRLVSIPHLQTAHFGGAQNNFTYPRYSIDFAFLRAYEDGKPANTTNHYFRWKPGGAKKDELVFISGNPGKTNRLLPKAQLEVERDISIPMKIEQITNSLRVSEDPGGNAYSGTFDPENPSDYWAGVRTSILKREIELKAALSNLHDLTDEDLMRQKTEAEKAFKHCVMTNEQLREKYGGLWDQIAKVAKARRLHEVQSQFHTASHPVLDVAVDMVRLCDPTETEEHRKQAKEKLKVWAGGEINPNYYYIIDILDHFDRARNWLPKDDPYFTKVLSGKSGEEFLEDLNSSLVKFPERDTLVKAGWKAIQESEDPAIVAAHELLILMRKHEKLSKELDAKEEALGAEIARALFACYGTNFSPDATMTLRFTDGIVKGFNRSDTIAAYHTTFGGLYDRNTEFNNKYPFNLPDIWLDRKDKIDMTKTINFVSTNDINVGNSGSVVVNKELEVVGLVIDGTLHNDFVFNDDESRAISIHVDGIMEALVKIYDAHRLVKELTGK